MFSQKEKLKQNLFTIIPFILLGLLWFITLFYIPTFDLDESLYRRAAEEMKLSGNYWIPTWDGIPLFHKPPVFYWLIILASYVIDGSHAPISALAARTPSLLCSLGILFALSRRSTKENFFAPMLYLSAFFPVLTGTAVIFDPLQTLLLLPFLFFLTDFFKTNTLTSKQTVWINFSIFGATAIKGLNGFIIPCVAFAIHALFVIYEDNRKFLSLIKIGFKVFGPSAIASFLYYFYLDLKMGRAFTQEFFLVHHFGRSQAPMEMHGGGFLYHPLFMWFSAGFMGLYLIPSITSRNWDWKKLGFPLTFALSFVLVFSFSATKLPHYTWPAWVALAYQGALINGIGKDPFSGTSPMVLKFSKLFSFIPVLFWTVLFLLLAITPISSITNTITSEQAHSILKYFYGFTSLQRIAFAICSGLSLNMLYLHTKNVLNQNVTRLAFVNLLCCLVLGATFGPLAKSLLFDPHEHIAQEIKNRKPATQDCVHYAGPHSPTISLNLGHEIFHNRCKEGADVKYLVVPEWKLQECKERGFAVLAQAKYLYLCGNL